MRLSTLTKLLFFAPLLGFAADEFTIYHPKYKSTEELVNLGDSAFGNKAGFSSLGGKVVINASPKTTASVLKLFSEIDRVSRQFKISFRLVSREESSGNSISFKNGQVSVGKKVSAGGTLSAEGGQKTGLKEEVTTAQLMEGTEAQMMLGNEWFPGGFRAKAWGGEGDFVNVGFKQREADANPALSLQSEVLLKFGEWKTIGEVRQASNRKGSRVFRADFYEDAQKKNLQVMVERQ